MTHPFINDLSDKTPEELQKAITDLMSKLTYAYRMRHSSLIHQLHMALDSYKAEYAKKMDEVIKKQNIQTKISIKKENER